MDKRKQLSKTERSYLQHTTQGGLRGGLGFGQAQLAGDRARVQDVAEGDASEFAFKHVTH